MRTPFESAQAAGLEAAFAIAARTVAYSRGLDAVNLEAIPGRTEFEETLDDGRSLISRDRDFLIRAADLVLDSIQVEPRRGDLVEETDPDGTVHKYKLMAPGEERAWEYLGHGRDYMRLHAVRVEAV